MEPDFKNTSTTRARAIVNNSPSKVEAIIKLVMAGYCKTYSDGKVIYKRLKDRK